MHVIPEETDQKTLASERDISQVARIDERDQWLVIRVQGELRPAIEVLGEVLAAPDGGEEFFLNLRIPCFCWRK